ncbi:MAG TPA: T9SS type A sorting domain-containing protein, partial [Bacteroidetes bacterium]|nr:T9SS type A sorting domain-containing protein [Bacteroidota bacterium]
IRLMKRMVKLTVLILIGNLSISFSLLSQDFGPRYKVDFFKFDDSAFEEGVVYVKLAKNVVKSLPDDEATLSKIEAVSSKQMHEVIKKFDISEARTMFPKKLFTKKMDDRELWGFDQWYAFKISSKASPLEVTASLNALPEVITAEPVLKIRRLTGNGKWEKLENSSRNPFKTEKAAEKGMGVTSNGKGKSEKWTPDDTYYNQQSWHYSKISLPQAWDIHNGGDNVIVSVHDGGIQISHPDLAANIWDGFGPDGSNTIPNRHGTHVAGTVAAVSNNSIGVAGVAGGDGSGNGARLMSVDIFNGSITTYQGYVYAAQNGAAISQNSWGYENPDAYNQPDLDGIDYFHASGGGEVLEGGVVIFAAGNENSSQNWYPACYEPVIAVAATTQSDAKASFSNYAPWVDISAPGVSIYSTFEGNSYGSLQGTSMACPHVSGVAALVVSIAPGVLTNGMVKEILLTSADDHYAANPDYIGMLGSGRLNAQNALLLASAYAVDNPNSFTAEALSQSEISLSWEPNDESMQVLVAYNTSNSFGIPNFEYSPGNSIAGGGEVLYFGDETSFLHEGLDAGTTYYYKVWSYNGSNYSAGLFSAVTTVCNIYGVPFSIGFDNTEFPNCWGNVSNTEPEFTWTVGSTFGGIYGSGSHLYFLYDSYGYGQEAIHDADLVSPEFNFSENGEVHISFKHFFKHRPGHRASFHYSVDGGSTWIEKGAWESTTANPEHYSQRVEEVEGETSVYFKWKYEGGWGYFWCVDSIQLTSEHIPNSIHTAIAIEQVNVYPNPFSDVVYIPFDGVIDSAMVRVLNLHGSVVFQKVYSLNDGDSSNLRIDLSGLAKGVYLIEIKSKSKSGYAKIVRL